MPPETTIISVKQAPKDWKKRTAEFVYIGRLHWFGSTKFGNSYKVDEHGREGAIAKFEEYARARLEVDPDWQHSVAALRGRTLVCHCKPEPCHGDVLVRLADELYAKEKR